MSDSNLLARLRLALIPGLGPITQHALVGRFGSAENVWRGFRDAGPLPAPIVEALTLGPDAALVERCLRWAESPGNRLVAFEDEDYPRMLRETRGAPGVLWVRGDMRRLQAECIAIVGARNATPQGLRDAEEMARELSGAGLAIVSGLALGIDAAAHRGGLAGVGSSVAVMGTGMDILYPRSNRELALSLANEGCLVTEFALGTPPHSGNFPRRNRIISGLARAVLVVEANEKSGSLLTAQCALDQNRDVLAMPGSIHSPLAKGCHQLIKEGAALVDTADDVFDALRMPRRGKAAARAAVPTVVARLARMQLSGQIADLGAGRFQRVERAP
jgi:DNA processing protein